MILLLLLLAVPAFAQSNFDAQVEAGIVSAAALARNAPRPLPPPRTVKSGDLSRLQQQTFPAPPSGQCGLKSFTVFDYELRDPVKNGEATRMTEMGAAIETTSPDCLRDYGFVQFIRGCVYHTRYDTATGLEIEKVFDVVRHLRGPRVVFSHPGFEIDQTELDPLYVAYPEETDRQALLYVPIGRLDLRASPASLAGNRKFFDRPDARDFLKDVSTPSAVAFIADLPDNGQSVLTEDGKILSVVNSSLDFRTCVYRLKDVSRSGDPAGADVPADKGGPVMCFSWMSRYTFDPDTKDFVTDKFKDVDPFCAQAPARVPLPGS